MPNSSNFDRITQNILEEIRNTLMQISPDDVDELVREIMKAKQIFVAGAGRSGLVMRCFAMRLMQLGLNVHVVGETTSPALESGDVLLIGSGSGKTERLINYAKLAGKAKAHLAIATTDPVTPIARLADFVISIPAPTPKSSQDKTSQKSHSDQPMGTLFEQTLGIMLDACVMILMERLKKSDDEMFSRHANLE